ncbi:AP-3 complex subunit sigma-1 isoform X1 [Pimephales promelas]|uniref:AP-3 complex subunit sigma-1 isoform X1 n=1 Tax=Pimephales promelas TaxID=90988 RepID=UPI0019559CEE|nr:AP-3 complex subunit sigma-1 isoform X1 [Pimephales promelas]
MRALTASALPFCCARECQIPIISKLIDYCDLRLYRRRPAAAGLELNMIKAILIFNNHGKPRLSKFYEHYTEDTEQQIIRETFHLVSKRDENVCNFLEGGLLIGGSENKLIYRHYATLYFVFCVDSSESELGILDLIQVFVETLDKCFENVCELDLIFHMDKVHNILAEMVMGGMVLETNMSEIITQAEAQTKMEKSEAGIAGAPARAVSAVKNMNLPEMPKNINIGDISIKVPNLPSFK